MVSVDFCLFAGYTIYIPEYTFSLMVSFMKVVPVKLSDSLTEALDALVKEGIYNSRNEALRDGVRLLIDKRKIKKSKEGVLEVELRAIARVVAAMLLHRYRRIISRIILFGSVAKGRVNEESDIDLLVVVRDGDRFVWRRKFIEEVMSVMYELGRYVSIKTFAEEEFKKLIERESPFVKEVLRHGVLIYGTEGSS